MAARYEMAHPAGRPVRGTKAMMSERTGTWLKQLHALDGEVCVMGILNCTPNSFSDGRNTSPQERVAHGLRMAEEGATVIDVGGESTRPGADFIPAEEELRRVLPVIRGLRAQSGVLISVDTNKAAVARAALDAGADIINDITALRGEDDMLPLAASSGAPVVLMHMQGLPHNMQCSPAYQNVVSEVLDFLLDRAMQAIQHGVRREAIILDPGFGFGKTFAHNAELFRNLPRMTRTGYPVLVGVSRKSMIGQALELPVDERLEGSLALAVLAAEWGARIVRAHDVKETVRALRMREAIHRHVARPAAGCGALPEERMQEPGVCDAGIN